MLIDKLIENVKRLQSPIIIGLDPVVERIPVQYFIPYKKEDEFTKISNAIVDFNKDIIDVICDLVPAVKPQMAFYEMYGFRGVEAFERTVEYAKAKGLIVVEDAKRNDIGNTALAYAKGHLGKVTTTGKDMKSYDVDFLTVSSYLGKESLQPFVDICKEFDKGVFILVKTSNKGNAEVQDVVNKNGDTISEMLANYIAESSKEMIGESGYSAIGAVVGATYPTEAQKLRNIMKQNLFLVPGYGTQGGDAESVISCFNKDGLGALVSASRSIIFGYEDICDRSKCTKEEYKNIVRDLTMEMKNSIYNMLREQYSDIKY